MYRKLNKVEEAIMRNFVASWIRTKVLFTFLHMFVFVVEKDTTHGSDNYHVNDNARVTSIKPGKFMNFIGRM